MRGLGDMRSDRWTDTTATVCSPEIFSGSIKIVGSIMEDPRHDSCKISDTRFNVGFLEVPWLQKLEYNSSADFTSHFVAFHEYI
jgi:hypothetical protein